MLSNSTLVPLMLVAGGMAATQSAINARLAGLLGSPVQASFVSFCVGALALLAVLACMRQGLPSPARLGSVPPLYFVGGVCGVAFITTAIFLVPRIGVVNVLFVGLAGQMIVSVLIDHHGLFGLERHPVNAWKVAGLALIVLGVLLLKRETPAVTVERAVALPDAVNAERPRAPVALSAACAVPRDTAARTLRRQELRCVKARIEAVRYRRLAQLAAEREVERHRSLVRALQPRTERR